LVILYKDVPVDVPVEEGEVEDVDEVLEMVTKSKTGESTKEIRCASFVARKDIFKGLAINTRRHKRLVKIQTLEIQPIPPILLSLS
jgi:hypothetical protein